jgi:hypothetical protein
MWACFLKAAIASNTVANSDDPAQRSWLGLRKAPRPGGSFGYEHVGQDCHGASGE